MRDFLKYTLAGFIGAALAGIVLAVAGMVLLVNFLTAPDAETPVKDNAVFVLDFNGTLSDRTQEHPLRALLGDDSEYYGLDDILTSIEKAKNNDKIKGIYLQPTDLDASFASLEEIREALADFKAGGKFVVAYADSYTQAMYYLCSVADKVMVHPQGTIGWHGLAARPVFYKDLLDKIGVDVQVFKVGTYKSAVEPFVATEMSEANREQLTALLASVWHRMLKDVSASRRLAADTLDAYADRLMDLRRGEEYVACGLADTLMYKDEVIAYLERLTNAGSGGLRTLFLDDMIRVKKVSPTDRSGNIVAVYYASGEIVDEPPASTRTDEVIVGREMAADLRDLRDDDEVKAVVLRINSPGGSVYASEQIWREVARLKEKKPVVVSMGDYAASGGYYIACAASRIVANPMTLTGSIGIFGMFPSGEKLLNDKLGIRFDVVKTNKFADMGGSVGGVLATRPFHAEERALVQNYIDEGYRLFVSRCAEGRDMTAEAIGEIAEGRVWTGEAAVEIGLADELGGIGTAVREAAQLAGIAHYRISAEPERGNFFLGLFDDGKKYLAAGRMGKYWSDLCGSDRTLEQLKGANPVQARMPFEPNIH